MLLFPNVNSYAYVTAFRRIHLQGNAFHHHVSSTATNRIRLSLLFHPAQYYHPTSKTSLNFISSSSSSSFKTNKDIQDKGQESSSLYSTENQNADGDDIYVNKNNLRDQVFSAISNCGGIKVTSATVRNLVNDLMMQHTLTEVPADALGRSVTCGLLMSNGMPDEHTVQITINGDGPLRGVCTITNGLGECKGYVGSPSLNGFKLEDAVGKGTVQVVKNRPDWPNPYNGITSIIKGDIDQDMGIYLAESEQRSCALAAATSVNGILCTSAGGYLVEQLPGCEKETIAKVEENLKTLMEKDGSDNLPTNLLLNGFTPMDISGIILDGLGMKPLQQITPSLNCGCSDDRLIRSLRLLPKEEVDSLVEREEQIEARCEFCGKVYRMDGEEVKTRMAAAKGDPSRDDP